VIGFGRGAVVLLKEKVEFVNQGVNIRLARPHLVPAVKEINASGIPRLTPEAAKLQQGRLNVVTPAVSMIVNVKWLGPAPKMRNGAEAIQTAVTV
jgi:hypothetical protein